MDKLIISKLRLVDHAKFLKSVDLEWDDVTDVLIDLEIEKSKLLHTLTAKQIKEYDEIMEIYEAHRFLELNKNTDKNRFDKVLNREARIDIALPDELDGYEE